MRVLTTAGMLIATTWAGVACYTMRPVTLDYIGAQPASRVWVTHQDQSVILVSDSKVFRGKLVGFVDGKYREIDPAQLRQLHIRKMAAGRTLALVGAGAAAFTVAAVLLSGGEDYFDPCNGDDDCIEPLRRGWE